MPPRMVCEPLNKTHLTTSSPVQFASECVCPRDAAQLCYASVYRGDLSSLDQLFSLCEINPKSTAMAQTQEVFCLLIPLSFALSEDVKQINTCEPITLSCVHIARLPVYVATWIRQFRTKYTETHTKLSVNRLDAMMLFTGHAGVSICVVIREGQMLAARKGNGNRRHVHSTSCQKV